MIRAFRYNVAMKAKNRIDPAFGKSLRLHRRRIEMSAEKLGRRAGLDGPRITRMEHGQLWAPPLAVVRRMASVLKLAKGSQEYRELIDLAVANRLEMSGLGKEILASESAEAPGPEYKRAKENPVRTWTLEEAAHRARWNIESDKARVVSARLLVRASNKREWEFDLLLPGAGKMLPLRKKNVPSRYP